MRLSLALLAAVVVFVTPVCMASPGPLALASGSQPAEGGEPDDLEAQRQQVREQAAEYNRKSALEQRRRRAESEAPVASPEAGSNLGIGYLFIGIALAAFIGLVLYLVHRARSPQVHCPRCSWSGRKTEAAQLGQARTQDDAAVMGFMPGEISIAVELVNAATGATACPRCGAHPLLDAARVAPPLPPRKSARPGPPPKRA